MDSFTSNVAQESPSFMPLGIILSEKPPSILSQSEEDALKKFRVALKAFELYSPPDDSPDRKIINDAMCLLVQKDTAGFKREMQRAEDEGHSQLYWALNTTFEIFQGAEWWKTCAAESIYSPYVLAAAEKEAIDSFGVMSPPDSYAREVVKTSLFFLAHGDRESFKTFMQPVIANGNLELIIALEAARNVLDRSIETAPLGNSFDRTASLTRWELQDIFDGVFDPEIMCEAERVALQAFGERVREMKVHLNVRDAGALVHDGNNKLLVLTQGTLPEIQTGGYEVLREQIKIAQTNLANGNANYSPVCHALSAVDGYLKTNVLQDYTVDALETRHQKEIQQQAPKKSTRLVFQSAAKAFQRLVINRPALDTTYNHSLSRHGTTESVRTHIALRAMPVLSRVFRLAHG